MTLESSLDSKGIKPVNSKGNQPWILIRRTDAEAEVPTFWPPDSNSQFTGKDSDARKDWGQEEKGVTENEMVGWHHQLNGHEFDQTLGDSEGQASLACYSLWGRKESDTTESNWATFRDSILFFSILNPLRGWLQCLMSCWLQHKVCDILHPLNRSTWSVNTQKSFKIKACSKEALENDLNRTSTCAFSHVWLCHPIDCRLPCVSVYGISQARMLEWVAISFSRGSSQPRDWTSTLALQVGSLPLVPHGKPLNRTSFC